jgi:BirA family biotin operon repressor/biotin-[acetyl-CoA-carboxylase] ligase
MHIHRVRLDAVDSTNTYAKLHAASFPQAALTVVTAETQTAGRGRFRRAWLSPKGVNLYASFVFFLPLDTPHLGAVGQVVGLSLASVLMRHHLHPRIKWPNDVQLNGKKVAGILCETSVRKESVEVVAGVGINVNMEASALAQIDQPATSLKVETGKVWDKEELLRELQEQLVHDVELLRAEGFAPFYSRFDGLMALKGQTVRCFDGQKEWVGVCHSLTVDGQLNLQLPDKTMHVVRSGDIK